MTTWLYDGKAPAAILIILAIEFTTLGLFYRPTLRTLLPSLAAGACLLLAWLTATLHAPWPLVAGILLAAGCAHGVEVVQRK